MKLDLAKKEEAIEELRKTVQTLMAGQDVTDVNELNADYIQTKEIYELNNKYKTAPEIKD